MLGRDCRFAEARLERAVRGRCHARDFGLRGVQFGGEGAKIIDERGVDVIAAEPRVAVGGEHLEDALVQFEDRDVECAAAEIEHGDLRLSRQLVEAVGEGRGGRLVDDAFDGKTGQFARGFRGIALGIVEIGGHGDDGARDLLPSARSASALAASSGRARRFPRASIRGRASRCAPEPRPARERVADIIGLLARAPAHEALHGIDRRRGLERAHPRGGRPTSGSPVSGKCTTEGVRRSPSASASRMGKPASITPMSELVVPRSMPTMRDMEMRIER